jgi:hypothetical protein
MTTDLAQQSIRSVDKVKVALVTLHICTCQKKQDIVVHKA